MASLVDFDPHRRLLTAWTMRDLVRFFFGGLPRFFPELLEDEKEVLEGATKKRGRELIDHLSFMK